MSLDGYMADLAGSEPMPAGGGIDQSAAREAVDSSSLCEWITAS